eukprot:6191724-Prymnesium_polylepis.1
MIGPYGDLKTAAKRPGPGSYDAPVVASQIKFGKFGSATRELTKPVNDTLNYAAAINKASHRSPLPPLPAAVSTARTPFAALRPCFSST